MSVDFLAHRVKREMQVELSSIKIPKGANSFVTFADHVKLKSEIANNPNNNHIGPLYEDVNGDLYTSFHPSHLHWLNAAKAANCKSLTLNVYFYADRNTVRKKITKINQNIS